jgi:general nucleoside transport system permease protein
MAEATAVVPVGSGDSSPTGPPPKWIAAYNSLGSIKLTIFAIISALVVGVLIIAVSDTEALGNGDFGAIVSKIGKAYWAIPKGAFGSVSGISEVFTRATPLIFAGLAVTVAFRSGLFNIGATGQMVAGGLTAAWIGFSLDAPGIVTIPIALIGAILGGALWGAIPGVLKARTGAHEVITTIMTNYIAGYAALWLLKSSAFVKPGRSDPVSKPVLEQNRLPRLLGAFYERGQSRAHIGFLLAIAAVALVWWLLNRSKVGFELRAVGSNMDAARYAGMKPANLTIGAFLISGGLAGLAGGSEILGTNYEATATLAGDIGFDAIAIALLGKSNPIGAVGAAFLFGILEAGKRQVQLDAGVPLDLVSVLRALIVLFIAAQLLTKAIWRVKDDDESGAQAFRGWGS